MRGVSPGPAGSLDALAGTHASVSARTRPGRSTPAEALRRMLLITTREGDVRETRDGFARFLLPVEE